MTAEETGNSIVRLENGNIEVHFSIKFHPRQIWIFLAIAGVPFLITIGTISHDMKVLLLEGLIGIIQILTARENR